MDERDKALIRSLDYNTIGYWVGSVTRTRGFAYQDRLGFVYEMDDRFAARVYGRNRYLANLLVRDGECRIVCTCPVGVDCKHGAALAFVVAKRMREGKTFQTNATDEFRLDEKGIWKAHGLNDDGSHPPTPEEIARKEALRMGFLAEREKVLAACETHDCARIVTAADDFLCYVDDDDFSVRTDLLEGEQGLVDETMEVVVRSLRESGMELADVVLWAYELRRPYHYFCPVAVLDMIVDAPAGAYQDAAVWRDVAKGLEIKLDREVAGAPSFDDCNAYWYLDAILVAWQRAGDVVRADDSLVRFVEHTGWWAETVDLMVSQGHYSHAVSFLRRCIEKCGAVSEKKSEMERELADVLARLNG